MGTFVVAGQRRLVAQEAALVQAPHLGSVLGDQQLGSELAKKVAQVGHVAHQHALRVVVAGRVHRLRQVDDDGAVMALLPFGARCVRQQDVEL